MAYFMVVCGLSAIEVRTREMRVRVGQPIEV
jgi:hypothetical protein